MSASKRNLIHPYSPEPISFSLESEVSNCYNKSSDSGYNNNSLDVPSGKKKNEEKASANSNYRVWTQDLEALKSCDQFFLKQTNIELSANLSSNYDVRNGKGQLVFKAVESIDPVVRDHHQLTEKTKPPFVLSIFDMKAGKEMLSIKAHLGHGIMLVYVKQLNTDDKIIGIIRRVNSRCCCRPPNYFLERPNGTVLLKIKICFSSCLACFTGKRGRSFKIYLSDNITYVGSVSGQLRKFGEGDDENNNVITASFPVDTTATNKALLLAATFMLDFVYFQEGRRPRKRLKLSKTCWIVLIIVVVLAIVTVLAIVVGGNGFQGGTRPGGRPGRFTG